MASVRELVTIRDVATRAGVSMSTVSLALNAPTRVAGPTRDRILAAADELGFVPKAAAVAAARRGLGRIGVLGPFASYSTAARRLAGVLRAARDMPVEIVVFDQDSSVLSPTPLLQSLPRTGRLDGMLIVSMPLDDVVVTRLDRIGLPAVLVDGTHQGLSSVRVDDRAGGVLAATHLVGLGHRRFAFLGQTQSTHARTSPAQARLEGFRQALAEAGLPVRAPQFASASNDLGAVGAAARAIFDVPEPPTAVFAADDLLAAGVLQAARAVGLDVPGDVSVLGFDDGELALALDLSTVTQPLETSGALGLEQLQRQIRGATPVHDTVLSMAVTPRATTSHVRAG